MITLNADIEKKLSEWIDEHRPYVKKGKVAEYIPALAKVNPELFAVSIMDMKGKTFYAGDIDAAFTLQSISKVMSLLFAFHEFGEDKVFKKVTMEPTGDAYNSITGFQLNQPFKILNPMVNTGAIAITSMIDEYFFEESLQRLLQFIQKIAGNPNIDIDKSVYMSEKRTASRNRALAYFLQDMGFIKDVETSLDLYFQQSSIKVSVNDIARIGAVLANSGKDPLSGEMLVHSKYVKMIKAYMLMSGMYNGSGEVAIKIGIPAKSGVSGAIMASVTDRMGIGILSPPLDDKGNSIAGMKLLQYLSNEWNLSIF